jgi:hypothetical protein
VEPASFLGSSSQRASIVEGPLAHVSNGGGGLKKLLGRILILKLQYAVFTQRHVFLIFWPVRRPKGCILWNYEGPGDLDLGHHCVASTQGKTSEDPLI